MSKQGNFYRDESEESQIKSTMEKQFKSSHNGLGKRWMTERSWVSSSLKRRSNSTLFERSVLSKQEINEVCKSLNQVTNK